MTALRDERARLLGYPSFAHYKLDDTMAKTPAAVTGLLDAVWAPARRRVGRGARRPAGHGRRGGRQLRLAPWDWRYFAEKLRKARFDLDESEIKPYLPLDSIIEAAFYTANRLFGLTFTAAHRRAGLSPGRARLGGERRGRAAHRRVLRRLFRAALQAQRRLDDGPARPGKARRRNPAARAQRDELQQGRGRRADAALLRRRAHAVPRVRPRAAWADVGRDLSDDLRHRRAAGLRRTALAALRALARPAGDPANASRATTRPASRCRRR